MKLFWELLMKVQKNLIVAIPVAMVFGIALGYYFDVKSLKLWIMPLTFLMVYPMMVTLKLKGLFEFSNIKLHGTAQMLNFLVMPLMGYLIGKLAFGDQTYLILGMMLTALLPTSGMTISWTGMAKGNVQEAIKMTVMGLLFGAALAPIYLKLFLGASIDIPLMDIFKQILVVVFLPMVLGALTQRGIIKRYGENRFETDFKKKFPALSSLGVVLIVTVAMALKAQSLLTDPILIFKMIVPLVLLYTVNFAISTFVATKWFNYEDGVALIYGTVMRNLSVCLAIAMTAFGDKGAEAVIIISLAYVIQVQAAAWYVKYSNRKNGIFITEKA